MNSHRSFLTILRINLQASVFLLGLMLAPVSVLAQAGWHPQTLPALSAGVTYSLNGIEAVSATEVWLAGRLSTGEAAILKTLDGSSWSLVFSKGGDTDPWRSFGEFISLSVVDGNHAWAAGINGLTAYTTDGGATWLREANGCNAGNVGGTVMHNHGLKAVGATNVWATGWSDPYGLIWHRPYSGNCSDWGYYPYRQEFVGGDVLAIDAVDDQNAWAVGYCGIVHTADGGGTWTTEVASPGSLLNDVAVVSSSVAWAVGDSGRIMKTIDGGASWVVQGSGVTANLHGISAVSADVAWAVGESGTIIKTVDGGATWRSQVSGAATTMRRITAVDVNTAWAIDNQAAVLAVTDGGVYQPLSAPGIGGVSPAGGPIAGGSTIDVSGRDFRPGARVYFGGIEAASVTYNAWALTVTTPTHAAGIVDVTVVNPDGQSATMANAFAFADTQPLIVSLEPSYGYVNTGVELSVYGAGLTPDESATTPVPTVNVNGTAVDGTDAGYGYVHASFPSNLLTTAGLANVTVTTDAGTSNTLPFSVNHGSVYVSYSSSAVTVPSLSGPIEVTFFDKSDSGSLKAAKVPATPERVNGSSTAFPSGYAFLPSYYYVITAEDLTSYGAANICFPYAEADITSAGLDESKLRLLRYVPESYSWTDVTFTLDTTANVICGTTAALGSYFAFAQSPTPAPAVSSVLPAISPPAGGSTVTISGSLFAPNATVTFGGVAATEVTVVNGIKITATVPAHALGVVDVVVTNPDARSGTLIGGFEYVGPPMVISVTPDSGHYGTEITVTGTGFRSGGTITFGGNTMWGASVTDTTITGEVPGHAAGLVDVVVTNADGQTGMLANAFTYVPAPAIAYVEPNGGPVEGGTTVTVKGTGFQTGATVVFDGTEATDVVVVNATTITAATPAHDAGTISVTVTNPDGQSGAISGIYRGFTYGKSPSIITWENPASITYGTRLSATQLNASANVEGTFSYSPAVGNLASMGTIPLTVQFTPTDTDIYTRAQKSVSLVVLPAQGDLNADGAVNVQDAVMVLQLLSARTPSTPNVGADVNNDDTIGLEEAIFILQKAAGMR
ncbi:MAG: IPT/TIG domain-containing protein [Deltaproteobacteria bacterium]|nr:IPT/TIG domain-containing protein [Deltaproteobacteria bacterium]